MFRRPEHLARLKADHLINGPPRHRDVPDEAPNPNPDSPSSQITDAREIGAGNTGLCGFRPEPIQEIDAMDSTHQELQCQRWFSLYTQFTANKFEEPTMQMNAG